MSSSGRKTDPIWNDFDKINVDGRKGFRAVCKGCEKVMEGQVQRLKLHARKCTSSRFKNAGDDSDDTQHPNTAQSTSVFSIFDQDSRSNVSATKTKRTNADAESNSNNEPPLKKSLTLKNFVQKTTADEKRKIDLDVGRFIYATNSSFLSVEHCKFKSLVNRLRPGYTPPSREQIGGPILDEVYEEELQKCKDTLQGQIVSLDLDGWSNIHNQPVICASVLTENKESYLVKTVDTSGNSHTTEYLTKLTTVL